MTPSPYMRGKANDNTTHCNQLTARMLTWEDERVSAPGLSLKIDEVQSIQTSAEKWDQSKAKEINSLIQLGTASPIHNRPMQIELKKRSRHINQRFHWLRNNCNEAEFFIKQLPTPLYDQTRRDSEANESCIRDLSGSRFNYLWKIIPNPPNQNANSHQKRKNETMYKTL